MRGLLNHVVIKKYASLSELSWCFLTFCPLKNAISSVVFYDLAISNYIIKYMIFTLFFFTWKAFKDLCNATADFFMTKRACRSKLYLKEYKRIQSVRSIIILNIVIAQVSSLNLKHSFSQSLLIGDIHKELSIIKVQFKAEVPQ